MDTHVLLWASLGTKELGHRAAERIDAADVRLVSAVTIYEVAYLASKAHKVSLDRPADAWLEEVSRRMGLRVLPITASVALRAALLSGYPVGDPADRMIFATAELEGVELCTADRRMLDYARGRLPEELVTDARA